MTDPVEERSQEDVLEDAADAAEEQDVSSVLAKNELVESIRYAFGKVHYRKRPQVVQQYNTGSLSRREFLKLLGFGVGGAFAGSFSVGYFIDKNFLGDPIESLTGYQVANQFNVEADGGIGDGDALDDVINSNQGQAITVPDGEYTFNGPIQIDGSTELMFEGTTIDPPDGIQTIFECNGNGWHVGGEAEILQEERNYCRLQLFGEGQFGDDQGRISWIGRIPGSEVTRETDASNFLTMDQGDGTIRLMNFDQLGPTEGPSDALFAWTDRPGTVEAIGLNVHAFNDNLFYIKQMQGEFIARDCYFQDNNVAAFRTGANGGTTVENCCVVATDWNNPAIEAGAGGVNHSCLAVDSGDANVGDIVLRDTHYDKQAGAGQFLRDMGQSQHASITVEDCQWTDYPDFHDAVPDGNVEMVGDNGGNPDCEPPEGAIENGGRLGTETGNGNGAGTGIC